MPSVIDAHRMLSWFLLRAPRDPRKNESESYRKVAALLSQFGFSPESSPVMAVGWTLHDVDKGEIAIFIKDQNALKIGIEAARLLGLVDAGPYFFNELISGPILLSGKQRPCKGGDSLGRGIPHGESGTFGCLVQDTGSARYILSCAHVLVDNTALLSSQPPQGPVWQPSHRDGGTQADGVGTLAQYAPIRFGGFNPNEIDAALAIPNDAADVDPGLRTLGQITGTGLLSFRAPVKKVGWKTNVTSGHYVYRTSQIQDFNGHDALFENQLAIVWPDDAHPFSDGGDSGSLVINDKNEAVGLLFATASHCRMSFANPISSVFNHFGVMPV